MSNPTAHSPIVIGLHRGWIEFKNSLRSSDMVGFLFPTVIALVVILFLRNVNVDDAPVSLAAMTLPSLLGMNLVFGGMAGLAGQLITEKEDGTLLRAKSIPGGMTSYVVGVSFSSSIFIAFGLAVILIPGLTLFDGVAFASPLSWLILILVTVFGLAATMPIGVVIGSLFTNPRLMGLVMLPIMGLTAISGIFYPITALPGWLQGVAQVFPMYWAGLGMRSALLPDSAAAIEIGDSWRHLETFGVLGAWAVVGLIVAPFLLRRMARRESGSAVAERQERSLQRGPS